MYHYIKDASSWKKWHLEFETGLEFRGFAARFLLFEDGKFTICYFPSKISCLTNHRAGSYSNNNFDMHSEGLFFESWPEHYLSCINSSVMYGNQSMQGLGW
jgi:hypothetical protein